MKINRKAKFGILAASAALIVVGIASSANASSRPSVGRDAAGNYHWCADSTTSRTLHVNATLVDSKGKGYCFTMPAPKIGPKGDAGAPGAPGAPGLNGLKGDKGDKGDPGTDATQTVTGQTNVSNWPESSGWATDAFVRTVVVTRQGAVDNSHCSGAADCFFYTFTLSDNGSFQTVAGKPTPNGTGGTISGVFAGTMQGVAKGQFYADSDQLTGTIPVSANGDSKPASTTGWATLALPGAVHTYGVTLKAYSWTYTSPTTCETWLDQINPGDDGQSAGDGNITGTVACS